MIVPVVRPIRTFVRAAQSIVRQTTLFVRTNWRMRGLRNVLGRRIAPASLRKTADAVKTKFPATFCFDYQTCFSLDFAAFVVKKRESPMKIRLKAEAHKLLCAILFLESSSFAQGPAIPF